MPDKRILITSRSFGAVSDEPLRTLEDAGWEVVFDRDSFDAERFASEIVDMDAIIIGGHAFPADLMRRCSKLKLIAKHGAGLDNIDLEVAEELGIRVTFTPGTNSNAVADLTFGLMIDAARHVTKNANDVRSGKWVPEMGIDVCGKTLGIVGFGAIGKCVARRAHGFDMRVMAYDPFISELPEEFEGRVQLVRDLDALLAGSDIVTIHTPLSEATRHLIGAREIALMHEGSILVNAARGGVVDEKALIAALESGHLYAAGLDCAEMEPIDPENPLLKMGNVVVTAHIGMYSMEATNAVSQICADNAAALLTGGPMVHVVV